MIEYLLAVPILILIVIIGVVFYLLGSIVAIAIMGIVDMRDSKKYRIHSGWQSGEYILGFLGSWFTVFVLLGPVENTL